MYLILSDFRYSAVRRQFGPQSQGEIPVLDYQMQVSVYCTTVHIAAIKENMAKNQQEQH